MTDQRTRMAPPGTPRWYDGEPKLPPKRIFKRASLHTVIWMIRMVVACPLIEVNSQ